MILYMTWFSERGRELAARITELSLSVSYGFWQSRYGGHPAVSKIQIRERGSRSLPDFLEEAFAQQKVTLKEMHWFCDGLSLTPKGAFEECHPKIVV